MPKNSKTGLPKEFNLKHDTHFVEYLDEKSAGSRIRMIPSNKIDPNPNQARSELGDLTDLISSIKSKGIIEPVIARQKEDRYELIAGERRFVASKKAGLKEVPCIIMNVNDNEAMEISLIENLQRKNLDIFEEADGLKALKDLYDYSHSMIADKIGKARSTITEIINISKIPKDIRDFCKQNNITSSSTLIEIAKLKTKENMLNMVKKIKDKGLKRDDTRELTKEIKGSGKKKSKSKIKKYVYNYYPEDTNEYKLKIEFNKETVDRNDIIKVLEDVLEKLKS